MDAAERVTHPKFVLQVIRDRTRNVEHEDIQREQRVNQPGLARACVVAVLFHNPLLIQILNYSLGLALLALLVAIAQCLTDFAIWPREHNQPSGKPAD